MSVSDLSVIVAWVSGVISADDACRALGIHRDELSHWEMDAIEAGRRIVAALPAEKRIEVLGPFEQRA